jgi:flagella basal body P-ring formation protein FlgA
MKTHGHITLLALGITAFLATGAAAGRASRGPAANERKSLAMEAISLVLPLGQIIEDIGEIKPLATPSSGLEVEAKFPGGEAFRRRIAIPLEWKVDGVIVRKEQVQATIALELDVPVASRPIRAGELIEGAAIRMARMRFTGKPGDVVLAFGDAMGRMARRDFAVDEPFESSDLEIVKVVKRGELLTVSAEFGRVIVTTPAIAHEDGAVGERVVAELPATNRVVNVEITARGQGKVVR